MNDTTNDAARTTQSGAGSAQSPPLGEALDFLRRWSPKGPVQLTAIDPETKGIETRFFSGGEDGRAEWIERHNRTRNIYFTVNGVRSSWNKKPTKKDIGGIIAAHADIDPTNGETVEKCKERALAALRDIEPRPSVIIDSGGGVQAFWRLTEAVPISGDGDIVGVEAVNKALADRLGGDNCQNADRIMRLPGTINHPDAKKRSRGRVPTTARLIYFGNETYDLSDLAVNGPPTNAAALTIGGVDWNDFMYAQSQEPWAVEQLRQLRAELASGYGRDFFYEVNDLALLRIGAWAPTLFPDGRWQTTGAYRVSSKALGRDLEEDLSIHPDGIRDFGLEVSLSPIQTVIDHGGAADAEQAAFWLCEKLGVDPVALGWTESPRQQEQTAQAEDTAKQDLKRYTATFWATRDLPAPDYIFGSVLATTTRAELIGPTGAGKTMLALAVNIHAERRRPFLHWQVPDYRTTGYLVYIDGEMSARLAQKRLAEAIKRHGPPGDRFIYLNRHDLPHMPPLNTPDGVKYMDRVIANVGDVAHITFDNLQSLVTGVMKEEETWKNLLPWTIDLTRRGVGQLWLHHTGHDASHGYGTKTAEWQMDVVMLMKDRRQENGPLIDFELEFTKARDRDRDNRGDFATARIWLNADDRWESATTPNQKTVKAKVSPMGEQYYEALKTVVARDGKSEGPDAPRMTTRGAWRAEVIRVGLISADALDRNISVRLTKYQAELIAAGWITVNGDKIWIIRRKDDAINETAI